MTWEDDSGPAEEWGDEQRKPVTYRSVSQVKQYDDCPYQYYLQRRLRAWQRPAAWFPQGTALHSVVEAYEKSNRVLSIEDAKTLFIEEYSKEVNRYSAITPNWQYWFRSGPYSGEDDIPRRMDKGLEQVDKYYAWAEKNPDIKPIKIGDQLAVELPFDVYFGDVQVKGFIDQVVTEGPVDVKSGNRPGDEFQLGTYAGAILIEHGIEFTEGWFWMGKNGKLTIPFDLTEWPVSRLTDIYGKADEGIRAEDFDPKPDPDKCFFCTVSASCSYAMA